VIEDIPVTREALPRTVRLVSSARMRESVLLGLADASDLAALAEIEGATSGRLIAEARGLGQVSPHELVHGVPHAAHINAAFAYARPRTLNRFNGPARGAWYAALDVATCIAEVTFHMARFLADSGIAEVEVGLRGEQCTATEGCSRSDIIFPLNDDKLVTGSAAVAKPAPKPVAPVASKACNPRSTAASPIAWRAISRPPACAVDNSAVISSRS